MLKATGIRLLKYILIIPVLFLPGLLRAQDSNILDTVIVEDYSIKSPVNYPSSFSTTIYTEDYEGEFETTADLINLAPGTTVRDFGGFGKLKTVSIRGSSNEQVVILLDGIKINNSLGGRSRPFTIPAGFIDRIEVIRGGSSAVAGS